VAAGLARLFPCCMPGIGERVAGGQQKAPPFDLRGLLTSG